MEASSITQPQRPASMGATTVTSPPWQPMQQAMSIYLPDANKPDTDARSHGSAVPSPFKEIQPRNMSYTTMDLVAAANESNLLRPSSSNKLMLKLLQHTTNTATCCSASPKAGSVGQHPQLPNDLRTVSPALSSGGVSAVSPKLQVLLQQHGPSPTRGLASAGTSLTMQQPMLQANQNSGHSQQQPACRTRSSTAGSDSHTTPTHTAVLGDRSSAEPALLFVGGTALTRHTVMHPDKSTQHTGEVSVQASEALDKQDGSASHAYNAPGVQPDVPAGDGAAVREAFGNHTVMNIARPAAEPRSLASKALRALTRRRLVCSDSFTSRQRIQSQLKQQQASISSQPSEKVRRHTGTFDYWANHKDAPGTWATSSGECVKPGSYVSVQPQQLEAPATGEQTVGDPISLVQNGIHPAEGADGQRCSEKPQALQEEHRWHEVLVKVVQDPETKRCDWSDTTIIQQCTRTDVEEAAQSSISLCLHARLPMRTWTCLW